MPVDEKGWRWWLEHLLVPVVLIVVTVVGSIVATNIQGRHDRQKELEFKTDLVGRMNSTATEAVFQSQAIGDRSVTLGAPDTAAAFQAAYDGNLRQWKVASAEINASLNAYFGEGPSLCWDAYSKRVTDYLRLNADPTTPNRKAAIAELQASPAPTESFRCPVTVLHLSKVLRDGLNTTHGKTFAGIPYQTRRKFLDAYTALGDSILKMGRPITASLVLQHANGF